MGTPIWIAFDFGIKGDYEGMYSWLDDHNAKECGNNIAFLNYEIEKDKYIIDNLKEDLSGSIVISKRDRIYVIWLRDNQMEGQLLFGKRKASPWTGYGSKETEKDF